MSIAKLLPSLSIHPLFLSICSHHSIFHLLIWQMTFNSGQKHTGLLPNELTFSSEHTIPVAIAATPFFHQRSLSLSIYCSTDCLHSSLNPPMAHRHHAQSVEWMNQDLFKLHSMVYRSTVEFSRKVRERWGWMDFTPSSHSCSLHTTDFLLPFQCYAIYDNYAVTDLFNHFEQRV